MAYVTTGVARAKTLTITETNSSGASVESTTYQILPQFAWGGTTFPLLTDDQFARLSDAEYDTRLTAFVAYVFSQYTDPGFDLVAADVVDDGEDLSHPSCPVGEVVPNDPT